MLDGDGVRDNDAMSKTGKFAKVDLEPRLETEPKKRKVLPQLPDENNTSTTGIMRAFTASEAISHTDDEDKPAE